AMRAGGVPPVSVNIFACNAGSLADFMLRIGLPLFTGPKNIGWCCWETSRLPESWRGGVSLLDEIWVADSEQQKLFSAAADKPVVVMPLPINLAEPAAHVTRTALEIEENAFLFLQVFDANDSISRKNLMGALQAFRHAFPGDENVRLLIKMRGTSKLLSAREDAVWARLRRRAAKDVRIQFLPEEFDDAEQAALLGLADTVVSLHRASAWGASLLEAAMRGVPVIASDCGGAIAHIPPALKTLVPVAPCSAVFDANESMDRELGHHWHDPDLAAAAKAMRAAFEGGRRKKSPTLAIATTFSPAACGERMAKRLREAR
ncbi:MAG TPA: glycosyltransferase, partial [Alphaproteobacteria bacterium]|nr:glycosyltransferase [Alphaproteobacteria bacterium]